MFKKEQMPYYGGLVSFFRAPEWDPTGGTVLLATRGLMSLLQPRLFDTVEIPE